MPLRIMQMNVPVSHFESRVARTEIRSRHVSANMGTFTVAMVTFVNIYRVNSHNKITNVSLSYDVHEDQYCNFVGMFTCNIYSIMHRH